MDKLANKTSNLWILLVIFIAGAYVRLYNFEDRLIYGPEQGMSLMTSAANLEKFSLLGETNWMRKTDSSLIPFHGAFYSYFLLPFIVLFNFEILPITFLFAILNIFTGMALFSVAWRIWGYRVAILSLFFFMFSAEMVHHSLFPWIVNPVPLLSVLSIWYLYRLRTKPEEVYSPVMLGVLSGLGFGMQNLYILFSFFVFFIMVYFSRRKTMSCFSFLVGLVVGSLPTVLFDLRHDFYHIKVFWIFFSETLSGKSAGSLSYYNFLYFYPVYFIGLALVTKKILRINKLLFGLILLLYVFINANSNYINFKQSQGMPSGITLKSLESASSIIARDDPPEKYNLVTLWDFDTRAHTLRYLMRYYHNLPPQGLEQYSDIDAIYAYAPENYNINDPKVYELSSFAPYKVSTLSAEPAGYFLYKLTK